MKPKLNYFIHSTRFHEKKTIWLILTSVLLNFSIKTAPDTRLTCFPGCILSAHAHKPKIITHKSIKSMLTLNQSKARLCKRKHFSFECRLKLFCKPLFDAEWQTRPALIFTCPLQSRGPSLCQLLHHSNPGPHSARVNKQTNKHLEQFRSRPTSGGPRFQRGP